MIADRSTIVPRIQFGKQKEKRMSQATVRTRSQEGLVTYTRSGGRELERPYEKSVVVPAADNKDPATHAWADARFATDIMAEHAFFFALLMPQELALRSVPKHFASPKSSPSCISRLTPPLHLSGANLSDSRTTWSSRSSRLSSTKPGSATRSAAANCESRMAPLLRPHTA